jgi:hypothetical protein
MNNDASLIRTADSAPHEYVIAMAELERRAARGELSLAQARREIFELRERFAAGSVAVVMRWAARACTAVELSGTGANSPLEVLSSLMGRQRGWSRYAVQTSCDRDTNLTRAAARSEEEACGRHGQAAAWVIPREIRQYVKVRLVSLARQVREMEPQAAWLVQPMAAH